jgi:ABC-type sugar transport system permease subunit
MDRKEFFQFTAPSNVVILMLMVFPLVLAFWFSLNYLTFTNISAPVFIGLDNYREILTDPQFWQALQWTLLIIAIAVPAHIILGFVAALLLDQYSGRIRSILLSMLLLPILVVPVIGTVVFKQLFDPSGLAAWFFRVVSGQDFVFTEFSMKSVILVHTIWISAPFALVTFFAGLQTIPQELVDAAAIDGASRLQQIQHVVIPHLRSLFILNTLIAIMDFFRLFDNVFVLTRLNPIYKADTVMTYNFRVAMTVHRLGKGNATAIVTVIAILVVLVPFLYYTYREQIEER